MLIYRRSIKEQIEDRVVACCFFVVVFVVIVSNYSQRANLGLRMGCKIVLDIPGTCNLTTDGPSDQCQNI